jgi:hypothetical protein
MATYLVGRGSRKPLDWAEATGDLLPNVVNRPKDVPSRGQALYHGSARIQAYPHRLTELIGSSD